jgi:cephalosporin hydroxylase
MFMINRIAYFLNWNILERSVLGTLLAKAASAKLDAAVKKCQETDDYIDLAFRFGLVGLHLVYLIPNQVRDEIAQLASTVQSLRPGSVLEIGTANGGTLFLWTRLAASDATIVSVDLPSGLLGEGYPKWKLPFYKSFARDQQRIALIRGDSHDPTVYREVTRMLGTRQLDFLFVDGDHTYEGVKNDFRMYSPLVRKGGLMAFHDIVSHPPGSGCEVSKFWNEVESNYNGLEIVKDPRQGWAGIGLLYV